jgi:transposase-like protein
VLPDASSKSIDSFLESKVAPGSRILSDGWGGYRKLDEKGFQHTATALSGQDQPAHELFPWVHISLSNLKRFLLGTHHQVQPKHLKRYVAEFNYRLNRRTMEPDLLPRLLRACLGTTTVTFQQLTGEA